MSYVLRRAGARLIDYVLWGMLTVTVLGDKTGDIQSPSMAFYISFWIFVFVEAFLISSFSTTAGKRLLGIYVFDQNENKLSFGRSLKRSFMVFGAGMGFFLPYVSLVLPVCVMLLFIKRRFILWDKAIGDVVEYVKPTVANKVLLAGFIVFLITGYSITLRIAFLHRELDFTAVKESVSVPYWKEIHPQLVELLSEETVLTPQAAEQAVEKLSEFQQTLQRISEELAPMKDNLQKQLDKMTIQELKDYRQNQLDTVFGELDSFLFSKKMRIGLFENALEPFKSAEKNKYTLVDGQPVFEDEEMRRQYDNYMTQLQTFLTLSMPGSN